MIHRYKVGWNNVEPFPSRTSQQKVSVLIAVKNEITNLPKLISCLQNQDYENYEVILVDDHSTDGSLEYLEKIDWDKFTLVKATHSGKKAALLQGLEFCKNEWILFTDGDVKMESEWCRSMMSAVHDSTKKMFTGPVIASDTTGEKSIPSSFYNLDLFGWMTVTGGAIKSRLHPMANGANMLIQKESLHFPDPFGQNVSPSGDDLFTSSHFFKDDELGFVKNTKAIVQTYPPHSWSDLLQQRLRWASKNKLLKNEVFQKSISTVALANVLLAIQILALLPFPHTFVIALVSLVYKAQMDWDLINQSSRWATGQKTSYMEVLAQQFILVPMLLWIGYQTWRNRGFRWKGTTYKT